LRIGMHGTFAGKDFRLLGRMVMGVEINGETYYWNEFNLQANTGESATLVCEEGTWRLFTEFEPDHPLTAADAVLKQVGDDLNLTGVDVRVTLVQTSRVYRIEGVPPHGERVGDEDNYFNAEAGDVMQVVSWTGPKVEYYNGLTLTRGAVDTAFRLPQQVPVKIFTGSDTSSWSGSDSGNYLGGGKFIFWAIIIVVFFFLTFGRNLSCSTSYEGAPVKRVYAPPPPLTVGTSGSWGGKNFHITARAVMEIGGVGSVYERNEYELTYEYGIVDLLVCGEKPGMNDWTFYSPLVPLEAPTPLQAAAQKVGDTVNIDGVVATISELEQFTVKSMDNTAASGWHQGDVRFGYIANSPDDSLLVRWDSRNTSFWRGKKISAKDFSAGISATNGL